MSHLVVISPGARTTIEDLGRPGYGHLGVPAGGAFDPIALAAANRLVGNSPAMAGLELTLLGPKLAYHGPSPRSLALVGATFDIDIDVDVDVAVSGDSRLLAGARRARRWTMHDGDVIQIGAACDGARAWLAIAGGIDVPIVMESRSTCVAGRFGGLEGRPLRGGDHLALGAPEPTRTAHDPQAGDETPKPGGRAGESAPGPGEHSGAEAAPASPTPQLPEVRVLRILAGPQRHLFGCDPLRALESTLFRVRPESDRTGVRLESLDPRLASRLAAPPGIAPEGTTLGAIQVPADGSLLILGPDRPVTGGYAKPALVARASVATLAQMRPGDLVRFEGIALADAVALHAGDLAARRGRGRSDNA